MDSAPDLRREAPGGAGGRGGSSVRRADCGGPRADDGHDCTAPNGESQMVTGDASREHLFPRAEGHDLELSSRRQSAARAGDASRETLLMINGLS